MVRKVTGNKKTLKGTQEYPGDFGVAVVNSYEAFLNAHPDFSYSEVSSDTDCEDLEHDWEEAHLKPVLQELSSKYVGAPKVC